MSIEEYVRAREREHQNEMRRARRRRRAVNALIVLMVAPFPIAGAVVAFTGITTAAPVDMEAKPRVQLRKERAAHAEERRVLTRRVQAVTRENRALRRSPTVTEWIHLAADLFDLPRDGMRRLAECESNLTPAVVNKTPIWNGEHASGLYQFVPSTFRRTPMRSWSVLHGPANALAAAWLIHRDGTRQWHCGFDGRTHG